MGGQQRLSGGTGLAGCAAKLRLRTFLDRRSCVAAACEDTRACLGCQSNYVVAGDPFCWCPPFMFGGHHRPDVVGFCPYGMGLGRGHGHGHGLNELFPASPRTAASRTCGSPEFSRSVSVAWERSPERNSARISARRTSLLVSRWSAARIAGIAEASPICPSAHAALRRASSFSSLSTWSNPAGAFPPRIWPRAHAAVPRTRELLSVAAMLPSTSTVERSSI